MGRRAYTTPPRGARADFGKLQPRRGAATGLALDRDQPAALLDHGVDRGQPQAGSPVFAGGRVVGLLKRTEQPLAHLIGEHYRKRQSPETDPRALTEAVCDALRDTKLDDPFLKEARSHGLSELKGHRSVGGMRASIYNAMPLEGVQAPSAGLHALAEPAFTALRSQSR